MEYLYRTRIGTRFGPDQVLGYVPGQVGPFKNFGANQMCSSKHLDRTRSGPGSEQIRRVNSILYNLARSPLSKIFDNDTSHDFYATNLLVKEKNVRGTQALCLKFVLNTAPCRDRNAFGIYKQAKLITYTKSVDGYVFLDYFISVV